MPTTKLHHNLSHRLIDQITIQSKNRSSHEFSNALFSPELSAFPLQSLNAATLLFNKEQHTFSSLKFLIPNQATPSCCSYLYFQTMDELLSGIFILIWSIVIDYIFNHPGEVIPETDPDILDISMTRVARPRRGVVVRRDNEFRSSAFPFLETRTPTDSLVNPLDSPDLSDMEKRVLIEKRRWLATEYPAKVAGLVARIVEDRAASPITAAVVLGLSGSCSGIDNSAGSLYEKDRDCEQFVAFSQILAQLGAAQPELLNALVAQDPGMTAAWRALLENHGFVIAEHPDALDHLGPNTVLFSPFVEKFHVSRMFKDRLDSVSELPMFVGDGCSMKDGSATIIAQSESLTAKRD